MNDNGAVFELTGLPLLSRSAIGRAEELRQDADALRAGWADAVYLRVSPRGQVEFSGGELVLRPAGELTSEPVPGAVFMGVRDGRHVWAVTSVELDGPVGDLRIVGAALSDVDAGLVTGAVAVLAWHRTAGFSALDGSPTTPTMSGWSRISQVSGHEEFPRTDPAIICLVHDGQDQVLLARQGAWPERRFSVLAGFVEAGESLETCVAREIKEEVGLDVTEIRYLGSQPWPFPRSVMIGFAALGDPGQPFAFSDGEIAEAQWFSRAQVRSALAEGDWASSAPVPLLLPGPISIARGMLESWAEAAA